MRNLRRTLARGALLGLVTAAVGCARLGVPAPVGAAPVATGAPVMPAPGPPMGGRMDGHAGAGTMHSRHAAMHGEGQGMAVGRRDPAFAADMALVHELLANHQAIQRTVINLPNGIRTVTESDDPQVAGFIVAHVERMDARLKEGELFNLFSNTIPVLFENRDRIRTEIERTATGVAFTQTSDEPAVVAALQAHAEEVSELVREGMVAMMRGMMDSGRGMGGMHGEGPMPARRRP
jgi:hypothetical protein